MEDGNGDFQPARHLGNRPIWLCIEGCNGIDVIPHDEVGADERQRSDNGTVHERSPLSFALVNVLVTGTIEDGERDGRRSPQRGLMHDLPKRVQSLTAAQRKKHESARPHPTSRAPGAIQP